MKGKNEQAATPPSNNDLSDGSLVTTASTTVNHAGDSSISLHQGLVTNSTATAVTSDLSLSQEQQEKLGSVVEDPSPCKGMGNATPCSRQSGHSTNTEASTSKTAAPGNKPQVTRTVATLTTTNPSHRHRRS